jgi:protease stability complex PrcB-like protein
MVVMLAASGCSHAVSPDGPGTPLPVVRLTTEPRAFSSYSAIESPQQLVLRDAAAVAQWWAAAWRTMSQPPTMPQIDFMREMVVVAALGSKPTSGYDVVIESATLERNGIVVVVRTASPPGSAVLLPVVTHPVDIARLPLRSDPVSFRFVP